MVEKKFKIPKLPGSISSLLSTEKVGYLSTISPKGLISIYPVAYNFDSCNIYFLTPKDSAKLKFLMKNPTVCFSVDNKRLTKDARGVMFQGQAEIFPSKDIIGKFKTLIPTYIKYFKKYPEIKIYLTKMKELPSDRKLYKYRLIGINPSKILFWEGYKWGRTIIPEKDSLGLLSKVYRGEKFEIVGKNAHRLLNIFKWFNSTWKSYMEGKMEELPEAADLGEIGNYNRLIQTSKEKASMDGIISADEKQLLSIIGSHYQTFESALNQALADGNMTEDEFSILKAITGVIYNSILEQAHKDGKLTEEEESILKAVRKELKIKKT
jgi:general stress protein 26